MNLRQPVGQPTGERGGAVFLALLAAVAILVPLLNLVVPASSPLHLSTYVLTLLGKYLCYAMLALAVDLVWGYCRHPQPRPRRVLCPGRLRHGHVSHAPDRHARRLRRSGPARLHGLPQLEGAAVVLARLQSLLVRAAHDGAGAGGAGVRLRLARLPVAGHRRLSLDHDAGAQLRADAGLLPQRHGLRRQQRLHRLQGHPRLRSAAGSHARRAAGDHARWRWRPATSPAA